MKVGIILDSNGPWSEIVPALQAIDESIIDTVGFYDRIHTPPGSWGSLCGWAMLGAIAAVTKRVQILPLVLDYSNHSLARLSKEGVVLAQLSNGRFELGIGAGDYPEEQNAWGIPRLEAAERVVALAETLIALRQLWSGEQVTMESRSLHLSGANVRPTPPAVPKIVVGVGTSERLLQHAITYADEINVYNYDAIIKKAQSAIAATNRTVVLSVLMRWNADQWPQEPLTRVHALETYGVSRIFIDDWHPFNFLPQIIEFAQQAQ